MSRDSLGEFERLVLLALVRLGDGACGAPVLEELEGRTGRSPSAGAVYVALRRMEKKGMVTSRVGEPTPGQGGRPRRHYALTDTGLQALRAARDEWAAMLEGVEDALEPGG